MANKNLTGLCDIIQYHFHDESILVQAMTHTSFANEKRVNRPAHYERIEFLGDAILEGIVSEYLYRERPKMTEGQLTRLRASLVCEFTLSSCAREIHLGEYVRLSKGEECTGGRERNSILCDLFESVLGAIYLDGGIEPARQYVYTFLLNDIEHKTLFYDAKSNLQELVQQMDMGDLSYTLVAATGPDHHREYETNVVIGDRVFASGKGSSIKGAEQMAAYAALLRLKKEK